MKGARWIAGAALALAACASTDSTLPRDCTRTGDVLTLEGSTDAAMLACVQAQSPPPTHIVLSSTGGNVDIALEIGDIIASWDATIEVRDYCNSSCANYFVPVARELVLHQQSVLAIHGGIDAGLVARGADPATASKQRHYALRHGIPPGWLFRRETAEAYQDVSLGNDVTGDITPLRSGRVSMVVVEPLLLETCLPHVPLVRVGPAKWTDAARQSLAKQRAALSGSLRCVRGARW